MAGDAAAAFAAVGAAAQVLPPPPSEPRLLLLPPAPPRLPVRLLAAPRSQGLGRGFILGAGGAALGLGGLSLMSVCSGRAG